MKDLLDVIHASYFAKVTEQAIRKAIKEGRLDATKYGNSWVIKGVDLEDFIDRRTKRT